MSTKEIALQIIHFLKSSTKEVNQDFVESLDVAIDCIADAFEVDKDEDVLPQFNGLSLKEILNNAKSGEATSVPVTTDAAVEVDPETKAKADQLKMEGNLAIKQKQFELAVEKYSEAIALIPSDPVYYSNRAAAYTSLKQFEKAVEDSEAALKIDDKYAKAYSRLGVSNFALGKYKEAFEAYKKGLEVEGANPSDSMKKGYETAKKRLEEQLDSTTDGAVEQTPRSSGATPSAAGGMPDLGNLANMFGGSGAGGAGGAPNFADMFNNPAIMQAAERMMSDPNALSNLMSNPAVQQMASQFGLGGAGGAGGAGAGAGAGAGGAPDFSALLNNPALRGMADSFMNNRGGNGAGNQ
ncbi:hypothetical protein WICPIJ_001398 [Wickerhamomyces pijperi]|uniref:SGTA homodimerisation domain-containing protein n=1 Tax=Wickerhamomyces pijperi TaxID=599730 RepID=A0A9P8TPW6_WICPI|nr:hypothetical protein WICPIJ_001398 [Wickerhamomyces pijperi]